MSDTEMAPKVKMNNGRTGNLEHRPDRRRGLKFGVYLLILLILGIILRILSGNTIVFANLVYSPGSKTVYPGTKTPEDTVKSFYLSIDSGDYEKAFELILEPDWTGNDLAALYRQEVEAAPALFLGWTEKERFIGRLEGELGERGNGITMNSIQARVLEALAPEPFVKTYDIQSLSSVYRVEASGNLLGACTIFSWEKEVTVLQFGKKYRVLLEGTKRKNSFYYQTWFARIERVGNLKGLQP
jgi:hypothetical protein